MSRDLSPREEEIVELCADGLTNEQIAHRLGLSIGTVNTYWLRIRLKVGGQGRADTVAKIIKERAERALRDSNTERIDLGKLIEEREQGLLEHRATLAMLQLAMDQIQSTVWATDTDLKINIIANGEFPREHFGVTWEVGKTVCDIFKTEDRSHPGIAAHISALDGKETSLRLSGEFSKMFLRVVPLKDEADSDVIGCISILNTVD